MDMNQMMKQARKMQANLAKAQDEISAMEFSAKAGGGVVEVTVTGDHKVLSVTIDPEAVDPQDVEMLQDMIVAATNEALREADDFSNERLSSLTGGMNMPGMM